jgi:hypothetical protein
MATPALRVWDGTQWVPNPPPAEGRAIASGQSQGSCTLTTSASSYNGSGTVTLTATVTGTPSGSVQFEYFNGSAWVAVSPTTGSNPDTGSPWSITKSLTATTQFRARYLGNGTAQPATSATKTVTIKKLTTYTKTYGCTASKSFRGSGTKRTDVGNTCYQGYYSSTNGLQKSVILFPYATIQSDLSGATITKVEVYLNAEHWGPGNGGTAVIGNHNYSTMPSSDPTGNFNVDTTAWTTKTGAKWCNVNTVIGDRLRDNTAKGILLGPNSSTSNEYYGYFSGSGDSAEPKLRITYTKYV